MSVPTERPEQVVRVWRCQRCGHKWALKGSELSAAALAPCQTVGPYGLRCGGTYELIGTVDMTPPPPTPPEPEVPDDWYRDAPPRTTRQRFIEAIDSSEQFNAGRLAWDLIIDAWDRVEDAGDRETYRDRWLAALLAELAARGLTE